MTSDRWPKLYQSVNLYKWYRWSPHHSTWDVRQQMNVFSSKLTCLGFWCQTQQRKLVVTVTWCLIGVRHSMMEQWFQKVLQSASFFSWQAAAALTDLYKKHPVLYNSSIVCSFEPKVIYRVRGCWWAQISPGAASLNICLSSLASKHWLLCHISYCFFFVVITILTTPDEAEGPSCGHSVDSPAVEPESVRRRHPSLFLSVETPLDDPDGHRVGLGPSSHPVEALWDLSLPHSEELCLAVSLSPSRLRLWQLKCFLTIKVSVLQGLCPVLEPEGGGGGGLDSQHQRGERVLPGAAESQLHHRQPCGRLRAPLLKPHWTLGHMNFSCTVMWQ